MTEKIFTRNFVLVFFAQFAFTCAFYILVPTLPIYLSRLESTETEIGVLIGIFFFSSLISKPFIGKALTRTPERSFMMAGTIVFSFTTIAYLLVSPFWTFLIVRIVQGIGYAFFLTASYTLAANISPEKHRGQSLTYFYMAFNLSGALGPSLGMLVINYFSFTHLFLICVGLSLCSLFITCKLERREAAPLQDSSVGDGFFVNRKALPPSIIYSFSFFIWGALAAFFPLYAINHGVANPGLFFTTTAIMVILGRALGGKILDLYSRERIILPCLFAYIASMVILAFSKTLPMFILVAMIWGAGQAFLMPSLAVYALDRAGTSPGPVMATLSTFADVGISLGPVIMGLVIRTASYPIMFLCLALTGIANLNYFYFLVRKKG
ncbi:MAG: MFS transporter [Thermodesulfobacteriota bacterium]